MGVRQALCLGGHRRRDLTPTVTDVDDDRATRCVEVLTTVGGADGGAVRLDRYRRIRDGGAAEDAAGTHGGILADETLGPRRVGSRVRGEGQTRPFGTVCQYVLLKTILPRCHSWFGFGGFGGWS